MNKTRWLLGKQLEAVRFYSSKNSEIRQQSPSQYCLELVRKYDFESYLCSLLLPSRLMSAAFAIRAFNVEIAVIQDQAREVTISGMRYNFWNDTLKKIFSDKPPDAPVPLELHRIMKNHKLSKHYFQRLLDARWKKWQTATFPDLEELEKYSEDTVSPLYYLLLEVEGIKDVHVDHVASHLGKAQGIVTLIRSVPHHAQKRISVLPQNILMKNSVSTESVFRGETSKNLSDVVFEVASRAKQHLDKAKRLKKETKKDFSSIFLPAVNVERYLERLRRADFDIYSPVLYKKENMIPFRILKAKIFSEWK